MANVPSFRVFGVQEYQKLWFLLPGQHCRERLFGETLVQGNICQNHPKLETTLSCEPPKIVKGYVQPIILLKGWVSTSSPVPLWKNSLQTNLCYQRGLCLSVCADAEWGLPMIPGSRISLSMNSQGRISSEWIMVKKIPARE